MGAVAYECGGIAVADGWLRILGGGVDGEIIGIYTFNNAVQADFQTLGALF